MAYGNAGGTKKMTGLWRGALTAMVVVALVGGAWAQVGKRKSPGSDICVAQTLADYEDAQYTTIQAAVNAALPGQTIEILDEKVYTGQVTIDGRDKSPWPGVTGGKNGIRIRYVPAAGAAAAWNHERPTIRYRDTLNTSPTKKEENVEGELKGNSGNFETNGALRVLRAKGVTIEGIAVDGGGAFAFGAENVWCDKNGQNCSPLNHGNAAISIAVAGQVTIRDCDLKNAFFGINIKDRNTGGVYGNPNKSDNDTTVPLSGFGKVGGHLFEYNKINANVVGLFFESAWDLGSSVRYNLIFNNKKDKISASAWNWKGDGAEQKNAGAFMFKDMYLSPVAIYNNTFYDNTGNFIGHWQSGGQHLIFNNIFSKSTPSQNVNHMSLDGAFPNRMHYNVFSIDNALIQTQCQNNFNCAANSSFAPGGCWVREIQQASSGGFGAIQGTSRTFTDCQGTSTNNQNVVSPGARIPSMKTDAGTVAIPTANEIRWLQTEGSGTQLPLLFKSLDATSANFLVPNWDDTLVKQFIKNKGWPDAGIRNNDGSMADLGAIPSTGVRQTTVGRFTPSSVVLLTNSGANASANFTLRLDNGVINNPKIKLLRWIAPVPENNTEATNWPSKISIIPTTSIATINNTSAVSVGNNKFSFTTGKTSVPKYGFFEIIIEGTDANGKAVTSDVGFLPYRQLEYFFDIAVYSGTQRVTSVKAGEPYTIRVTARNNNTPYTNPINQVVYELQSDPTAFMRYTTTGDTLSGDKDARFAKDYNNVYFSRAGSETIFASGVYEGSGGTRLVFMGSDTVKVRPGDPAKAVFTDPISSKQLGTAIAPVINRGVPRDVKVEVQDKFGNAVDVPVQVTIASDKTAVGDVGAPANIATKTVGTTGTTGVASFIAQVTNGQTGDTFEMTATIPGITQTDNDNKGKLRLGRALDRLEVFYSDTLPASKNVSDYFKPEVTIDGKVGDWFKITVKIVVSDTVRTNQPTAKYVLVEPDDNNLKFSASSTGASPANIFQITNGVATFWVGAPDATADVSDKGITVVALTASDAGAIDNAVMSGQRGGINFEKPSSTINHAVVYGNGQGQPDSVLVYYADGGAKLSDAMPTSVTLTWGGVALPPSTALAAVGDYVLRAVFTGAARPTGFTSVVGLGTGSVVVAGGATPEESGFSVYDAVGPVLSNGAEGDGAPGGRPQIVENPDNNPVDTLIMMVSEKIADISKLKTIKYSETGAGEPAGATDGVTLGVVEIPGVSPVASTDGLTITLVVQPAGGVRPVAGGWIRLDPTGDAVTDVVPAPGGGSANNKPHDKNRWVQLRVRTVPPTAGEAWYTGDSKIGKPDYAYVKFNKAIELGAGGWFDGGSIKFDGSTKGSGGTVAIVDGMLSAVGDDKQTLRIDLSLASSFADAGAAIRTVGEMPFTLTYNPERMWDPQEVKPVDRAAPVLAATAILKTGLINDDGSFSKDTLIVYYSEKLGDATVAAQRDKITKPLTIKWQSRTPPEDNPSLRLLGDIGYDRESGFYRAAYLIESDLTPFPESGDSVHIDWTALIGDVIDPPNVQEDMNNKWQPLRVIRSSKWTVKIKNNPFVSDKSGSKFVEAELSPNVSGTDNTLKAFIKVFDNVGALVADTTVIGEKAADGLIRVYWKWHGENKQGRLVGTGTYLFKATCESIEGDGKTKDIYRMPPKTLGVVRK